VNSFLVEGWGIFSFIIIISFTLLSVSTSIPQRRIIEATLISAIVGIASFIIDISLKGADFRIIIPTKLLPFLWIVSIIILIIFGIIVFRRFPLFTLRTKLITSFVIITVVSLGILGFLTRLRINSILNDEVRENLINSTTLFGLISALVAIVIAVGFAQILTIPIERLTRAAKEISQGNFETDSRITTTSADEIGELSNTLNNLTEQLENLTDNLEDQVTARTRDLEDRAAKLQIVSEIARDATIENKMHDLLDRAVTLISERFDLYHVGIYLIDTKNEYAILVAGNEVIGQQLIDNQHKYQIASDSNVGVTCVIGESFLAPNDEGNTQISYHPLFPNTASQMVLPLKVGDKTLGAVDLHSMNPEAFQQTDIPIFSIFTDQLAIAIQKIQYREEIERALKEQEKTYGIQTRESWKRFIQEKENITGYRYRQNKVEPTTSMPPEVIEAWTTRETVTQEPSQLDDEIEGTSNLTIPLKIRGEVIGVLNIQLASNQVPTEINNFIQELANRFSLILENARLVEAAQRRVEREHLTGEITNKIRQTLDIDSVLRTAILEIGETLNLAEVEVQMGDILPPNLPDGDGNPDNIEAETGVGEA